jgi:tricorn protease
MIRTRIVREALASFAFLALTLVAAPARAADALPDGFYRFPSIGGGTIVFASEGDLWRVPEGGGTAMRLTAYEGDERFPRISPDGRLIAFTAQYEGNDDVYVMPAGGGEPERLTFHPASDQTLAWTADGKILFRSRRDHPHNDFRCYTIDPAGGPPRMIPLEPAAWLAFEPSGSRIALQKIGLEYHTWKRYQGGEAEQIYVGKLDPLAFTEVTHWDGKDAFPMWAGDGRIYFLTDRWGRPNLASMLPDGGDVKRLTTFEDYDVRWPSMGDGRIVYQHGGDVWSYELSGGRNEIVPIVLPSDRLQVRERFVDPMASLGSWGLAKDGERIALETRGDLFVTRTHEKGLIRRLTQSSAARTKFPAFSPDGQWIATWTEVDGEEQLLLHSADNGAPPKQLGKVEPGWHYGPTWSPDGKRIAWADQTYHVRVSDAATGAVTDVDRSEFEITQQAWSHDSRYLAYTVSLPNGFNQVKVWDSKDGKTHEVTDGFFNSFSPSWDPKGKYLFVLSDRYVNPRLDRFEARFIIDQATLPCVIGLQADGTLPFAARGDVDPPKDEDDEKKDSDDAKSKKKGKPRKDDLRAKDSKKKKAEDEKVEPVRIDFDGIVSRIVEVPVAPANYAGLWAVEGKLHFLRSENEGMMPPDSDDDEDDVSGADLLTYDIEDRKLSTLASGVQSYDVSMDGKVLVYRTKDGFVRVEAGATEAPEGDDADDAKVKLDGWSLSIDPRAEWKQMLREAWRLQRDFFYDPKMHGVDWNATWDQYAALADRMATRDDLDDMLGELLGELDVGHAYKWGGDTRRGKVVGTGLLAADLSPDAKTGAWRIDRIYRGDYPDPDWSSPLARADLRVKEGQWLVAIDGRALVPGEDYLRRLANRADQEVELSINDAPKLEGARRIVVKTVGNDTRIRYATWIRDMRQRVSEKTGGQVGYIHLYDMGGLGLRQFARDFPPQWDKRGLIIDDRWNHGGFVAPMILAHLDRKLLSVGSTRYAQSLYATPDRASRRYLVALINRQGGSDCETLAQGFKDFGLGPVIGTRTWGGWVGIRGDKPLRDGGMTTQPEFGGWDARGQAWMIEGHGVDPDIVIDLNPDGLLHGNDVQLDRAIEELMTSIARDPHDLPKAPPIIPRPLVPVR